MVSGSGCPEAFVLPGGFCSFVSIFGLACSERGHYTAAIDPDAAALESAAAGGGADF